MGKIGDLWVRLGLKKDGYTKGMNEAKKENEGFGASLGKMKAGALAVWAAIGTAVVGFAKEMINGTNRIGDAWNHTTAQMKAGWDVFIQSVSNWNWDNFIGRIRESAAAAKELQEALDFEFEVTNSINLQKSMMSEELAQLQIDMRDVNKSYEERAAAAQKYLDKVEPIYQQEIDLRKSLMEAYSGQWLANTGLENTPEMQKYLQQFLVDYGRDQDLIKAVTDYNDKNASRETWEAARDYLEQYGQRTGNYAAATMAQVYETIRADKDTVPLVKAIQDYYNAQAAYNSENRRIISVKNSALAGADAEYVVKLQQATQLMTDSLTSQLGEIEEYLDRYQSALDKMNETLPEVDWNPASRRDSAEPFEVDIIESPDNIYDTIDAFGVLGGAISNITGLVDSGAASWTSYGSNVMQAIAQAIPAIASLTAAKNAEANANTASMASGAGSAVASIPIVGPVMAIAAIASVVAALANIPKFAEGGIVGGSSYYGDKILARLNSGEMVLNQDQQARLLAGMERPSQEVHVSGDFRISGRDLRLVLDRYDKYREQ